MWYKYTKVSGDPAFLTTKFRITDAAGPCGMSEYIYQNAWCHIPENNNLQLLQDYFISGSYYTVLHYNIFSEQGIWKDMEVTDYALFDLVTS
jgi:hypothetical protein